jgi:hypothetical protein
VRDTEALLQLLSACAPPAEVDFSGVLLESAGRTTTLGGHVWAKYAGVAAAERALRALHNHLFCGTYLSARFELGVDGAGRRITLKENHHTTIVRQISSKNRNNTTKFSNTHDYSSKSVVVNNTEYPFPTGLYLTRVLSLQSRFSSVMGLPAPPPMTDTEACLRCLMGFVTSLGSGSGRDQHGAAAEAAEAGGGGGGGSRYGVIDSRRYAKELTEAMAMVDAVERALRLLGVRQKYVPSSTACADAKEHEDIILEETNGRSERTADYSGNINHSSSSSSSRSPPVRVYVLGDGVYPLCTALIALHFPYASWQYHSIDPLLQPLEFPPMESTGSLPEESDFRSRFHQHSDFSENFVVPIQPGDDPDGLAIVISCHSHAPLQEFWGRLQEHPPADPEQAGGKSEEPLGLSTPRCLAISMPCCAQYGTLYDTSAERAVAEEVGPSIGGIMGADRKENGRKKRITKNQRKLIKKPVPTEPIAQFDDFEVYSPKRTVRIYAK